LALVLVLAALLVGFIATFPEPYEQEPTPVARNIGFAEYLIAANYAQTLETAQNWQALTDESWLKGPPVRAVAGYYGVVPQTWRTLVCSYDWPCEWALAVVDCESTNSPSAYNPAGPYIGLFQVWEKYGGNLYDPEVNVSKAYGLYQSGGSAHWPNCPRNW